MSPTPLDALLAEPVVPIPSAPAFEPADEKSLLSISESPLS
jgi:hypothetical protein